MQELKDLSLADLQALFEFFKIKIVDSMGINNVIDVKDFQKKAQLVNDEIMIKINKIIFKKCKINTQ